MAACSSGAVGLGMTRCITCSTAATAGPDLFDKAGDFAAFAKPREHGRLRTGIRILTY